MIHLQMITCQWPATVFLFTRGLLSRTTSPWWQQLVHCSHGGDFGPVVLGKVVAKIEKLACDGGPSILLRREAYSSYHADTN